MEVIKDDAMHSAAQSLDIRELTLQETDAVGGAAFDVLDNIVAMWRCMTGTIKDIATKLP